MWKTVKGKCTEKLRKTERDKKNKKKRKVVKNIILLGKATKVFSVLSYVYSNNGAVQSTGSLNITVNDSRSL